MYNRNREHIICRIGNDRACVNLIQNDKSLLYYDIFGNAPGPFICLLAGTHGNEPAASEFLKYANIHIKRGYLRIIPCINIRGLANRSRYQSGNFLLRDINRNYTGDGGRDWISQKVCELTRGADLTVDFHEGWGFHNCQNASMGSTITPTNEIATVRLAEKMANEINGAFAFMPTDCKFFTVGLGQSCEIKSTLSCYMEKNNQPYILIETTGQNDIQSIDIRQQQIAIVINCVLKNNAARLI